MRAAVITVSSSRAAGGGAQDESGPALASFAERLGGQIAGSEVVPDDRDLISDRLRHWCEAGCELVLTTGGTGFSPTDVTPEATRAVVEREAPGIAEAIRLASREHTRHWMLSRATAGIRGRTVIINFPGSPRSIAQAGEAIADALPHALELAAGRPSGHG